MHVLFKFKVHEDSGHSTFTYMDLFNHLLLSIIFLKKQYICILSADCSINIGDQFKRVPVAFSYYP